MRQILFRIFIILGVAAVMVLALQPDASIFSQGEGDDEVAKNLNVPNVVTGADQLDPTFGVGNGLTQTRMDDSSDRSSGARGIAIQADGKLVAVGIWSTFPILRFAVVRYDAAGNLDPTFDGDGRTFTDFGTSGCEAMDVVIQPDGKIVVAGRSRTGSFDDFAVVRYNPDGSLDASFGGGDGIVITQVGGTGNISDRADAVALQADGKIVVAGETETDAAIVRYNTDGSLDTTFDLDGIRIQSFGPNNDEATGVVVGPDDKITIIGNSDNGISNFKFVAARFGPDGSLDPTFDADGIAITTFPSSTRAADIAMQPDGKAVAVGYTFNANTFFDMAAVRYNVDGSLDTSFDFDGIVTTSIGIFNASPSDEANSVVLQPDGKIVLAGGGRTTASGTFHSVVRYNPDGSLDTSFSGSGISNGFSGMALGVALQGNKIVIAGEIPIGSSSRTDFAIMRFRSNGRLDTTFQSGVVKTPIGVSNEEAMSVALQTDGRIVAAGFSFTSGTNNNFALVRYHPRGTLDTSFDGDGKVTTVLTNNDDTARDVVIQPDGKMIALGYSLVSASNYDLAMVRYDPNGSLDASFGGGDGIVTTPIGSGNDFGSAVLLQPDDKIVAFGDCAIGSTQDFCVARYNPDGTVDTSFGGGSGFVTTPLGTIDRATSAVLQPDGKILGAGRSGNGSNDDFLLVRYNADGTLDTTFDGDGILTTPLNGFDFISTVILQPDDKIIAVGSTAAPPALSAIAVARYNADGTLDTSFDTDGIVITDIDIGDDSASAVDLMPDGKIIIAGSSTSSQSATNFVIVRYETNGALDATYGDGGVVITAVSTEFGFNGTDFARDVLIQPDGKILAAGTAKVSTTNDFALVRYGISPVPPTTTFVVNSALDTIDVVQGDAACLDANGNCTLRAAIQETNASPGTIASINFNIPSAGVQTITLSSNLTANETVVIDGYTQPGATPNTLAVGNDANLLIDINGNGAVIRCFDLPSFSVVRGLVVRNCDINSSSIGILIFSGGVVEGNFIGTNPAGTAADGNSIGVQCGTCRIGGATPAERNLISGNTNLGVNAAGIVQGNYIGTDRNGASAIPNTIGIGNNGTVGGTGSGDGNLVAFNTGVGIKTGDGSYVRGNSVFSNGGLGLDVGTAGISANDNCDANATQNFPTIGSANSSGGTTNVTGFLNSKANATYLLEFFSNTAGDPSGNGEGKTLIGTANVTTNSFCTGSFNVDLPVALTASEFVTATATSAAASTSEFSNHFKVENPATLYADLGVVVTDTPHAVVEGENITYDIVVTNNGPQTSSAFTITDSLPFGITFVSASPGCSESGGTVTCSLTPLASGASTSVNILVSTQISGFSFVADNTASVSSAQDYNSANNSFTAHTSIARKVPNTVNYTFTTSTDASLTDMSSGTTTLIASGQNDISVLGNAGFDFCFMESFGGLNCAPSFAVTDNGIIRFENNPGGIPTLYQPLGQSAPYIAPFASNQRPHPTTGKVHYKTIGSAPNRVLVIEWRNMQADIGSAGAADLTYQVRLYETTGVIEFVYGSMQMSSAAAADSNSNDPQIGFSSGPAAGGIGTVSAPQSGTPTYNGLTTTPVNNVYTAGTIGVLNSTSDGSRRILHFTPPVPNAPSSVIISDVAKTFVRVSWADSSTNENGFLVYRSADGINFRRAAIVGKNTTTTFATQLDPGTNYTFRVHAVTEGGLSAAGEASQSTLPPEEFISIIDGDWGTASTWNLNRVPTDGDNATIADGTTVNIIGFSCLAFNLKVGQGSSGVLQYSSTQSGGLTVENVIINPNASFISAPSGTSTHNFSLRGNFTNNGTFSGNTSRVFFGSGEQPHIIGGATPTGFKTLNISTPENVVFQNDASVSGDLILTVGKLITGNNTLTLTPTATPSGGNSRSYVIGNLQIEYAATGSKTFRVGTPNGYSPVTVNVTALGVNPSSLMITANEVGHPNAPSPLGALQRYWTLTETGDLAATLTFNYLQLDVPPVTESSLELKRYTGSGTVFDTIPATLDTTANTATTSVGITDFSDWTLLSPLAPTAAGVTVAGRVLTADGRGIGRARLSLTDPSGLTRTALTNAFGYYRFDNILAGETYVVSVQSKSYQFINPNQVIVVTDELGSIDFTALPGRRSQ